MTTLVRGMPGTTWEGMTNDEALGGIAEILGGPPVRGRRYLVTLSRGDGRLEHLHGEYRGLFIETTAYTRNGPAMETHAMAFGFDGKAGTALVWPLDVQAIRNESSPEAGQGLAEYAIVLATVAVVAVGALMIFGQAIVAQLNAIGTAL